MRILTVALIALTVLSGCKQPPLTYNDVITKLTTGGYALIYGGSSQVATQFITNKQTLTPGTLHFVNLAPNVSAANQGAVIDSSLNASMWGAVLVPAGDWALNRIHYGNSSYLGTTTNDTFHFQAAQPVVRVAPGEVVYIGQFDVAAPTLSAVFSERKAIRRDNFNRFRDELRATDPYLAGRVVNRPLQSTAIINVR
jgi:hypothetical protein